MQLEVETKISRNQSVFFTTEDFSRKYSQSSYMKMGSTFYCNHRVHPYASSSDSKSRLLCRQSSSARRRPDSSQSNSTHENNSETKSSSSSMQASKIGKYLIFGKNIMNSFLHCAVDVDSRREYSCRVLGLDKYREFILPYFQIEQHKNINKIVEILQGESHAYVIFEPSYGDLHSYVRSKRKLKEDDACRLFKQIVQTVSHCHQNGVVLRDLKLRKFVFQNKERTLLKLETFDDAHMTFCDQGDMLTDKHGCPAYVSPEILESTSGYSGRAADMWSLGVMLYTMLFGRYPFHDNEPSALFSKIRSGNFLLPDTVSSKAKCLLRAVLRRDPTERLKAQELLEHPWFNSSCIHSTISSRTDRKTGDQCVPDFQDNHSFYS